MKTRTQLFKEYKQLESDLHYYMCTHDLYANELGNRVIKLGSVLNIVNMHIFKKLAKEYCEQYHEYKPKNNNGLTRIVCNNGLIK